LYYISKSGNPFFIFLGKDKLLKFLLERYKFDINTNDYTKQTPLFFAAAQNQMKCA
jgi:ankyrin repeat protein